MLKPNRDPRFIYGLPSIRGGSLERAQEAVSNLLVSIGRGILSQMVRECRAVGEELIVGDPVRDGKDLLGAGFFESE